ncbi:MAG: hypothetical protein KAI08_16935 [Bacteroidales bacterium]|nr:hypothetical protein [Bacteroidales bacterium]
MNNYVRLILVLFFSLLSCNKANETDHSLTLLEYQELGMPDYNSVWSMEDYSNAFFVLNTLKYGNLKALPVRDSEKSGVLFSRMISIDNLSFLQDEALPLWARADMIKWFVNTLMELKVVYTTVGTERQYYVRELMDIDIFRVSVAHLMLELGQKINESNDPSDIAMNSDYPHIQKMYLDILSELLGEQQNTSLYPEQTLELLADSVSSSVRRNMEWFDKDASAYIKNGMLGVIESTSSRKIRTEYKELTDIL